VKYKHIYLTLLYLYLLLFFRQLSLQTRPLNRFARTISQMTRIAPRKCLVGVSSMKNFFTGDIPSPKISTGILHANRKSRITVERQKAIEKFQNRPISNRVKKSNGDFTSGLIRPLAAEIVFLLFSATTKALITSKRYKIDGKCLQNTNRKPWSLYRLLTSLPVSNAS
jgi:hypothetical protein